MSIGQNQKKRQMIITLHKESTSGLKIAMNGLMNYIIKFRKRVVTRIYNENINELDLNRCPKCNGIARTPKARQCRYCKHDWH